MSRLSALVLGVRLAVAGGPGRLVLMATGVGLGVALLLGGLGVLPAYQARSDRLADRNPYGLTPGETTSGAREGVLVVQRPDRYHGAPIIAVRIATVGRAPAPPGLSRAPAAGEVAVSPALAALLRDPANAVLRERYAGRVVATIGAAGLVGPHELLAYVGIPRSTLPADLPLSAGFGLPGGYQQQTPAQDVRIAVLLGMVGLLVPVLVFIATATRLSAAAREQRLTAVRLVGATPEQARLLAATEAGVAALAGAALGGVLFLVLRQAVASSLPVPAGVRPADLSPPLWQAVLVLLGAPVLAVATALTALRHVVTTPLGVARQSRVRRAGAARLLPLAAGLVLLALARLSSSAVTSGRWYGVAFLLGGAAFVLLGLAVGMPALARLSAAALARAGGGVAGQLAARRLQLDPTPVARVVTGAVLVVFVTGWLMAFLPLLARASSNPYHQMAAAVRPGTVLVQNGADVGALATIRGVPGVRGATLLRQISAKAPRASADGSEVIITVLDCAALNASLREPLPRCGTVPGYRFVFGTTAAGPAAGTLLMPQPLGLGTAPSGPAIRVPAALQPLAHDDGLSQLGVSGQLVLPPSALPSGVLAAGDGSPAVIATDGRADTVERIRTALAGKPVDVVTPAELIADAERPAAVYTRLVLLGVLVSVLVAAASLALTSVDAVRERRRSFAALVAAGTPAGVLRRSVLVQTVLPLFLGVAVATGCAGFASAVYLVIGAAGQDSDYPMTHVPWLSLLGIGASAVIAVALATTATLPAVRAVTHPSALRME
ncbi:MAG: FtsX-like permease family protein [Mycobacteriales bacterium]